LSSDHRRPHPTPPERWRPVNMLADPQDAPPAGDSPRAAAARRIPELDGLRGLAIFLVILCHYISLSDTTRLPFILHRFAQGMAVGWSGVDLFFVLSGFLIGGILLEARCSPQYFRTFYMRRVHRILPIYYLWILLFAVIVCAALLGAPFPFEVTSRDLLQIPIQLAFLQDLKFEPYAFVFIWFIVTWSLAVEEQFYLLAPPLIRYVSLRRLVYVLSAAVVFAPIARFYILLRFPAESIAPA